jgi:menaquinol-cytochrome c reductase iron-sulfur subunit
MNHACPANETPPVGRRAFFKTSIIAGISALLGLVPFGAGLAFYLDPLRRKSTSNSLVRVSTLDALPQDGVPRKFAVLSSRADAWNKFQQSPIGAVYLRHTTDGKIEALNVVCPHAGCFVDYIPAEEHYRCPCHDSTFALTGKINKPSSPAPRGLDSLDVEIRNAKEIWVKFQNFEAGHAEKIPVA